jgi:hypothetical protein
MADSTDCAECGEAFTAENPPNESVWTNTPDGTGVVELHYHAACWERHKALKRREAQKQKSN